MKKAIPVFELELGRTRICLKAAIEELDRILNMKPLPADDRIYLSEIRWSMMTALGWIETATKNTLSIIRRKNNEKINPNQHPPRVGG